MNRRPVFTQPRPLSAANQPFPLAMSCVDGSRIARVDSMFFCVLVGCSLVFGLLMRSHKTAGPDGFRGQGPILFFGL